MVDSRVGYAVWPSGVRWIVLGTVDGWRTVVNRTPVAVPTDGGLVLAAAGDGLAVGVLPHEQLTVSPVLSSSGTGRTWVPSQLPGALAPTATSLARSEHATYAVLAEGTVVALSDGTESWRAVATPHQLDPSGLLTVTGVFFPDGRTGLLTATGPAAGPVVFSSIDGGSSWVPAVTPTTSTGDAVALQPCLVGSTWVVPIEADGHVRLFSATQPQGPWSGGPPLAVSSRPVVGCSQHLVWIAVPEGGSDVLEVAGPGGGWTSRGSLGTHLVTLSPVSDTQAFASDDDASRVLAVSGATDASLTRIALPDWVATVGGAAMRN
jgi:hypothetical protein